MPDSYLEAFIALNALQPSEVTASGVKLQERYVRLRADCNTVSASALAYLSQVSRHSGLEMKSRNSLQLRFEMAESSGMCMIGIYIIGAFLCEGGLQGRGCHQQFVRLMGLMARPSVAIRNDKKIERKIRIIGGMKWNTFEDTILTHSFFSLKSISPERLACMGLALAV